MLFQHQMPLLESLVSWRTFQLILCKRNGTIWTERQSIAGHMFIFTSIFNASLVPKLFDTLFQEKMMDYEIHLNKSRNNLFIHKNSFVHTLRWLLRVSRSSHGILAKKGHIEGFLKNVY